MPKTFTPDQMLDLLAELREWAVLAYDTPEARAFMARNGIHGQQMNSLLSVIAAERIEAKGIL